jgi:mRNA interferase MazF
MAAASISLEMEEVLLHQMETLAAHLGISQSALFQLALEQFIEQQQSQYTAEDSPETHEKPRVVRQGDLFWVQIADDDIPHPHVVIQDDLLNHSRLSTVVVCALTSNPKRAALPGNVLLDAGEANLSKQSVVEVSKVSSIEKAQLGDYIGSLDARRMQQIFAGMRLLQRSFFDHQP